MPEVVEDIEEFYVDSRSVACDGGGGVLGHPKVYLAIDHSGQAECPYCSRRFIYAPDRASTSEAVEVRDPG